MNTNNPMNQLEQLKTKNKDLVRQNTKYSIKIRTLEKEILALKQELINGGMTIPFQKVKDVIRATLQEYDSLVSAFKEHSNKFDDHARRGLLAILYYDNNSKDKVPERKAKKGPPTREVTKKRFEFVPTSLDCIHEDETFDEQAEQVVPGSESLVE